MYMYSNCELHDGIILYVLYIVSSHHKSDKVFSKNSLYTRYHSPAALTPGSVMAICRVLTASAESPDFFRIRALIR